MDAMAPPKLKFHPLFGVSFDEPQLFRNRRPGRLIAGNSFLLFWQSELLLHDFLCLEEIGERTHLFSLHCFTFLTLRFD